MHKNSFGDPRFSFCVLLVLLLFAPFLSPSLLAQTSGTAALTGTVTDPTGAVIANATVTATNTANGQVRNATTGSDGAYRMGLLPPGVYNVKFEASGFETSEVPGVQLDVTETPVLNRSLTVGSQSQQVTVEAETETVQTASSTLGMVIAPKEVVDIPLSTRNYLNIVSLTAGANAPVNNADAVGKGGVSLSVNGQNANQNNFQMDGAVIDNFFASGAGTDSGFYAGLPIPNPDAIQEFKIQTSTYDAGYGRNPGANVNVVTRGGTNQFHGTGFEFFRNTVLNANDWFYKRTELTNTSNGALSPLPNKPPVMDQNQFGGTFGGPIKKDKLFFFLSYQQTSQRNGISSYGFESPVLPPIPGSNSSAAYNRGNCAAAAGTPNWTSLSQCDAATTAFATALATALSPNCAANAPFVKQDTTSTSGSVQIACPAGNQLAAGANNTVTGIPGLYNVNPVAINILQLKLANGNYYVPGSTTGPWNVNTQSSPVVYSEYQGLANFDYTINSKNTLSERYMYSTNPTHAPFGCGTAGATGGLCVPGAPIEFQYWEHGGNLTLTSLLSNNVVNSAHLAIQRFSTFSQNLEPYTATQVGMTPLQPAVNLLPQIMITGELQLGGQIFDGLKFINQQEEVGDQISWTRGKHTFRFGGEFERDVAAIRFTGLQFGNPQWGAIPDFLIGRASCAAFTGTGTCSATNPGLTNGAGSPNETSTGTAVFSAYSGRLEQTMPFETQSLFAQDDVKVTSRLTLNLGLRWEWFSNAKTVGGGWSNTWTSLVSQQPNPGTGCTVNGVALGINTTGAAGTGCSLVGFAVPANFPGPVPAGVYVNKTDSILRATPKLDNFAPRVGFAWQPLSGNSRFVLRGGAGYFFDRPTYVGPAEQFHSNPPFAIGLAVSPLATLATPFVIPPTIPGPAGTPGWTPRWVYLNSAGTATSSNLSGTNTVLQDFSNGLVYEWNLNTQYEFLPSWVMELGYVGSRGIRINNGTGGVPINLANLAGQSNPLSCGYDGNSGDCITTNTSGNLNLRVPYLGYSPAWTPASNTGQTKFNSLQLTVRKQLSHGLTLQAAYTWSSSFLNYYTGNPAATVPGINPEIDPYGINATYHPQRLSFNYSWDLPLGKHDGIMGQVLNGWTWSGVTTIQNGTPLQITDSRDGTAFALQGTVSGLIGQATLAPGATPGSVASSGSLDARIASNYFNTSAFCTASSIPACTPQKIVGSTTLTGYGNYGLDSGVLGPGQNDWDMTLAKMFRVTESKSLEFRTEFFNAFNHPQFNNPGTNVGAATSFGQITSTSVNPRLMQFALKFMF